MWSRTSALIRYFPKDFPLSINSSLIQQQIRTTFVLKRRHPVPLHKKNGKPKTLRSRHYIYDLVKDTSVEKQPDINVILTKYVEGLGNPGDEVAVRPSYAYDRLLLPGLAVYALPENIKKYKNDDADKNRITYSSATALFTIQSLSRITLSVIMNGENPWILQPWHIKTSFRKCCYIVPEDAITLPEQPIKGPDMNIEGKEFYVQICINNTEKFYVRCRLHHWSTNLTDRLPWVERFWEKPADPIYPEFEEILSKIPKKLPENVQ